MSNKNYTTLFIKGVKYKVPSHKAKRFREMMGEGKKSKPKTLTKNQWDNMSYGER